MLSSIETPVVSSSETSREKLSDKFIHISHIDPLNKEDWGSYLAGLFEGDGHFSSIQQVVITFSSLDKSAAEKLCKKFGHGNVNDIAGKAAVNWIISNNVGIIKFLNLINGHLRIQRKLDQVLHNMIPLLNNKSLCFNQTQVNTSNLLNSWWLAGFTDADGIFYIQVIDERTVTEYGKTRIKGKEIRLHFKFSIKDRAILDQLSKAFGSSVQQRKHPNGLITYYWSSSTFKAATLVHNYFHSHSLQTTKWLNFLKWRQALVLVMKGEHLTPAGFRKIKEIKAGMYTHLKVEDN